MIDLYYWPTPNGHKITLFLEEAGLEYRIVPTDSYLTWVKDPKGNTFDGARFEVTRTGE